MGQADEAYLTELIWHDDSQLWVIDIYLYYICKIIHILANYVLENNKTKRTVI